MIRSLFFPIENVENILTFDEIFANRALFVLFVAALLVMITIVLLNIFIIATVVSDHNMRNYTNIQFASMSVADILVGAIAMPFLLVLTL